MGLLLWLHAHCRQVIELLLLLVCKHLLVVHIGILAKKIGQKNK